MSRGTASYTFSNKFSISPSPRSLFIKLLALKDSKSSRCSPVPIKTIGLSVAATALSAPPPFAWPSNFVIITLPIATASLKAYAYSKALYPILESNVKIISSGWIALATSYISSKSAYSYLCLPDVSTIIIS